MFICTLKASNIKFFAVIVSAVALLITLVAITQGSSATQAASKAPSAQVSAAPEAKISFEKIRTNDDRVAFLRQFGWEVTPEALEEVTLKLPGEFDRIMTEYNEIQKSQGLDLSKYKGQEVVRYTYEVKNYPDYNGEVHANIIVCKNRVVGGDICSADLDGFITSLERPGTGEITPDQDQNAPDTEPQTQGEAAAAEQEGAVPSAAPAAAEGEIADAAYLESAPLQ